MLKHMEELNASQTLVMVSAKLPAFAGAKWCCLVRELQNKDEGTVLFKDLVKFVQDKAKLTKHPVFSPAALKRERNKVASNTSPIPHGLPQRRSNEASSFATSSIVDSSNQIRPSTHCPLCNQEHSLEDCTQYKEKDLKQRVDIIKLNGLCFGCLRK